MTAKSVIQDIPCGCPLSSKDVSCKARGVKLSVQRGQSLGIRAKQQTKNNSDEDYVLACGHTQFTRPSTLIYIYICHRLVGLHTLLCARVLPKLPRHGSQRRLLGTAAFKLEIFKNCGAGTSQTAFEELYRAEGKR